MNTDSSWPIELEIPLFLLSFYYDSGVVDFKPEWRSYISLWEINFTSFKTSISSVNISPSSLPIFLYHTVVYFYHMLYFLLFFSSFPACSVLSSCFIHIFMFWMVQLPFIIINHWGYLHPHQSIFGNVIYNDRVNFKNDAVNP